MTVSSPDIELNGVPYKLYEEPSVDPYVESALPKLSEESNIPGASRQTKNANQGILSWRWDDWSLGEGQYAIDSEDPDSWRKYFYNDTGAVDVLTPGEVGLGFGVVQSYASGATTYSTGPYLVLTKYDATLNPRNIGFLVNQKVFMHNDDAAITTDTWNDMSSAAADAGNLVSGPPRYLGGYIFATYKDGTGAANTSRVRRITAADPDVANITTAPNAAATMGTVDDANSENPIPSDNRLHIVRDASGTLDIRRKDLDTALPGTFTSVDKIKGVGSEGGVATLGSRLHVLSQYTAEEPRVHIWDGTGKGYERVLMPEGYRVDTTPYENCVFVGDILYIGGYEINDDGNERGAIGWVAPGRSGSWRLRDNAEVISAKRVKRFNVAIGAVGNQALFAPGDASSSATKNIFVYDIANGGISQFIDTDATIAASARITSMRWHEGLLFIATHLAAASGTAAEVRVYRTKRPTESGYFTSSARIFSSFYDFGYREEFKTIRKVTIETAPLQSNTSATVVLEDEAGNLIDQDVNGDVLKIEGAGTTSKTFIISGLNAQDAAVTRIAKALRVRLTLTANTSGTSGTKTPIVRCVTTEADITGYQFTYDIYLAVMDMEAYDRILGRQVSGEEQTENIRKITRFEGSNRVIPFHPYRTTGADGFPEEDSRTTRYPVPVEIIDFDLRGLYKGNAFVRLKLREL